MKIGNKYSVEKIAEIYGKKGGNITATCTALGITRKTFYSWKRKFAKLSEAIDDIDESKLDFAESKLMEHIDSGDVTSLIFFLKTKGKSRGYVEKVENEVNVNGFEELLKSLP
ncbi:MAG: hypothetical protein E7108_01850 [Bacteroidales bacterium]|nr:hypothetical protein [Bacteroidales bacterium]